MKDYYATNGLNGMRDDLIAYAMANQIEDEQLQKSIRGAASMDLVAIGSFIETVYAQDKRDAELAQIAAGAAVVFASNGFLDIGKDGTANAMARAMLRDAGEPAPAGANWPDPKDDPAKKTAEPVAA